jgi:hypothetical protein
VSARSTLLAAAVLVAAGLAARAPIVPVAGFRERQWSLAADGTPAALVRETRTRWARVVNETDATLARPGDVRVEWRGFLAIPRPGALGVVAESAGPAALDVDGRALARVPGGAEPRGRGSLALPAGPQELIVRVDVPARGGFFRAVLRLPDGRAVPLENAPVTTSPVSVAGAESARRFRAWADPALALGGVVAAGALLAVLRRRAPADLRAAEASATILVLAVALLVPHGAGLDLWGTFSWGGLPPIPRAALLLAGLAPWLAALRGRRASFARLSTSPALAALAALAAFWLLRERRFWGDAWITLRILEGHAGEGPFGAFFWKEPLDRLLAVLATRAAAAAGRAAAEGVAFTSCAAGAALVGMLAADRRRGGESDWTAGAVLTSGAMLLFFGHVENYSWVSAAVVVFLALATRAAAGDVGPAWAGAAGGLAIAFHPLALFAVAPATLALAMLRRTRRDVAALLAAAALPPLALVLGAAAAGVDLPRIGLNRFADDPAVLRSPAAAFAPAALAAAANRLLLVLSPGVALALLAGAARARRPSPESWPIVAAAAGAVVHVVFLQGKIRPDVSDWDLYAPAAFPIAMLAGRALRGGEFAITRLWCTGVSVAGLVLGVLGNLRG